MREQLREKVLNFFSSLNLAAGVLIPRKPFVFRFVPSLNPVERRHLEDVLQQLLDEGIISFDESLPPSHGAFLQFRLTTTGEERLYSEGADAQEKSTYRSGAAEPQRSLVPISSSTVVYNISHSNVQVGHHNKQILAAKSEEDIPE